MLCLIISCTSAILTMTDFSKVFCEIIPLTKSNLAILNSYKMRSYESLALFRSMRDLRCLNITTSFADCLLRCANRPAQSKSHRPSLGYQYGLIGEKRIQMVKERVISFMLPKLGDSFVNVLE